MKKHLFLAMAACWGLMAFAPMKAGALTPVVVEEESITEVSLPADMDCSDRYYCNSGDNWFIQLGAGINVPFLENDLKLTNGEDPKRHITATYNIGFGHWFTPYLAWRATGYYGAIHWDAGQYSKARMAQVNVDLMWDMLNTVSHPKDQRFFSIVPYVGIGGAYTWNYHATNTNIVAHDGDELKRNSITLPVSAGLQFRFRVCEYADIFAECRASFYGDNFNNYTFGDPIDINLAVIGGVSVNIGGRDFNSYNPCTDMAYIATLNSQVNTLRGELAATATALAAAEAQLPCPDAEYIQHTEIISAPLMTTVGFSINSAKITDDELINIYNTAQYLSANPGINVVIVGYADKDTGTADYNQGLSLRRANAVYDLLVNKYHIDAKRLSVKAEGSSVQPFSTNDWNRVVIFTPTDNSDCCTGK